MSAPSLPLHTLQKQFLEGLTRFVLEFFQDVEKVVTIYQGEVLRYQEENRGLRSLLNDVIHPEMKVHTKDGNRSTTTVRDQAPEQTTPEFAEPLAKMAKTEPTEQSRFDSSKSLAAKHGPKEVLQPSVNVPKEEQTEISVSSELLTSERLPGIPSVVHMEASKPYTLADTPHGSETHILQPLGVTKGQQIEYDRRLAPEGESRSDNGLTVECFKSEDDEDTGRLDITTSLQDMAFGNFHTATECPGLSSWEDIFNKDLGSLEPPKTSYKKNMLLRVVFSGVQKYLSMCEPTFDAFLEEVSLKFHIPHSQQSDLKVYDPPDTKVDAAVFEEVVKKSTGTFRVMLSNEELVTLNFTMCDTGKEAARRSPPQRPSHDAKALIENILMTKPGGERVMKEYAKTKSLTNATRRQMINILAAEMTETHGTSPPKSVRVMYARGIVALFPYLEDPYSKHGYEHYYDPERGSGYLAWRLKTIQRKTAEGRSVSVEKTPKNGGPGKGRSRPFNTDTVLPYQEVEAAVEVLKHSSDEGTIREKMKATFIYRRSMVKDDKKSTEVFSVFPRYLDTPGLIEQDFRLLFGEVTANKLLETWSNSLKAKIVRESHGLVPTTEVLELMCNAKSGADMENGWDSDMSAVLLLLHLLPPSAQGRKRPGKMSASQAADNLIKFLKEGSSPQQHLDYTTHTCQPYLLVQGPTRSRIQSAFIVIDNHALPSKAAGSLAALDELFKAYYVFGRSYTSSLTNFWTFLQTTIYNIDVGETKESPRVAELRARMMR
ncbi:uncharacterized protein LOC133655921 isoform X2 [Entelurus aequoreus]|uniref:uncharacterized protein LOC133655921 isoform X2 n=1 Tax=Entelurus aequoreus TaxID=161455 RepID=UPI002B1D2B0D|nr:uncharacterized protein LOC133655921 isoform X2 [Entelurus aequoreus]